MSLSADKTYSSGDILTAADMNTNQRDNIRWLGHRSTGGAPMCRVYHSANQTINDATDTDLAFNSERFDPNSMHDTVTNNQRITVPSGGDGKYLIGAHITWQGAASPVEVRQLGFLVNATTLIAAQGFEASHTTNGASYVSNVTLYDFAATDYVTARVRHDQGASLRVEATPDYSPEFWALWVGE